ncbi:peptidase family M28-domain-containing protein [Baffinella frigidus]|nr:peptidase family M28-domain-containing protein [Cryptophyta sp. CCMP2293]
MAHISGVMERLGWHLERDCFEASTPLGVKPMCNLVASSRPQAGPCLLDIAAHFESKHFAGMSFQAATDSAAPVGIMLDLAEALTALLESAGDGSPCLRLVFFDGEEAFKTWNEHDSLYGARHLASKWAAEGDPFRPGHPRLDSMRALVLLDLLGHKHPRLTWHFENTRGLFERLEQVEQRLRDAKLLDNTPEGNPGAYFSSQHKGSRGGTSDDHVPFLRKGVPIVHLIPKPFPSFWHTARDAANVLHFPSVADLSLILRVAVAELYHL